MNPTVTVLLIMMAAVLTVFTIILYSDYRRRLEKAKEELNRASGSTKARVELKKKAKEIHTVVEKRKTTEALEKLRRLMS